MQTRASSGHLFILVGPSGSGKTSLIREVCRRLSDVHFIPTITTRKPRPGEINGREYYFVSAEEFQSLLNDKGLLEWETIHGNFYGTGRRRIEAAFETGEVGITSLDVRGGVNVRRMYPRNITTIFVLAGTVEALEARLEKRGDTADTVTRMSRVAFENSMADQCDYELINASGRLDEAAENLIGIMQKTIAISARQS